MLCRAPVSFEEGLRRTIVYEFVKNAQGHAVNKYYCSIASCLDNEIHAFIFGLKKSVFCFKICVKVFDLQKNIAGHTYALLTSPDYADQGNHAASYPRT